MNSSKSGDSSSKRGIIGRSMRTPDSDMVILDSDTYATVSFLSDIAVTRYLPGVMLTLYAPPSSHVTCCMRVSFWYMHMMVSDSGSSVSHLKASPDTMAPDAVNTDSVVIKKSTMNGKELRIASPSCCLYKYCCE